MSILMPFWLHLATMRACVAASSHICTRAPLSANHSDLHGKRLAIKRLWGKAAQRFLPDFVAEQMLAKERTDQVSAFFLAPDPDKIASAKKCSLKLVATKGAMLVQ